LNKLLKFVTKLSCNEESEESEEYTVVEMNTRRKDLISRLDPYLRIQSKKRGITIIQNTERGFETEDELLNLKKNLNKLLYVQ
jgi:hypothetical protein